MPGIRITPRAVRDAVLNAVGLSFAHVPLGLDAPLPSSAPPVLKAFADEAPQERFERGLPDYLTLRLFEQLSLAARARLLLDEEETSPHAPIWASRYKFMQPVSAKALRKGLIEAAAELTKDHQHRRGGFYISGAYIRGDLDLTNLNLPFSVRLIGCAIDGALRIGRTELVTLDISGCAVRGIFGSFLRTHGSLRLRRLVSTSVVDLGGAKVSDVFDATDSVVFPLDDPPKSEAFVGDRGIFNLSLANLSNEARLMRARIYGGLTLKGCRIERSLFIDDAILRAPLAFLERLGADVVEKTHGLSTDQLPLAVQTSWRAELKLAKELHGAPEEALDPADAERRDIYVGYETLERFVMPEQICSRLKTGGKLFRRLLEESPRARASCLRADGLVVTGSLFARSIRSSGRVRINYARIGGSVHLEGARMRSSSDIANGVRAVIERLDSKPASVVWPTYSDFAEYQLHLRAIDLNEAEDKVGAEPQPTWTERDRDFILTSMDAGEDAAEELESIDPAEFDALPRLKRERSENESFALDLREARIGGRLSLTPDQRKGKNHKFDEMLCDVVTEELKKACKCTNLRHPFGKPSDKRPCWCKALHGEWDHRVSGQAAHKHAVYANGQFALDNAVIDGDLDLHGILANLHGVLPAVEGADEKPEGAFLRMRQCEVKGDLNLMSAVNIIGIDARHAVIGARLLFARHSVRRDEFKRRALMLRGRMRFSDAVIGGDATLLFDPDYGPDLYLARAKIGGRLHVLPAKAPRLHVEIGDLARRPLSGIKLQAPPEDAPEIDLRTARAAEFGHAEWAWPQLDKLRVEGFVYEQTTGYGPLTPRPRHRDRQVVMPSDFRKLPEWQKAELIVEPIFWTVLSFVFAALIIAALVIWLTAIDSWLDRVLGIQNILLLAVCGLFAATQKAIAHWSTPRRSESDPRAIFWLGLQHASPSVYQKNGLTIPLQPHVQAGRVLRSAGLILSANLLERDRLLRRHEQLSWRNNWPARIVLQLADLTTRFGFDPLRTMLIALIFVGFAGVMFHDADRRGLIRPIDGDLLQLARSDDSVNLSAEELFFRGVSRPNATLRCDAGQVGCAASVTSVYPAFSSTLYAFDVMAPGLDLGQEDYWRPMSTEADGTHTELNTSPFHAFFIWLGAPLLKIIGWLLATAIAVSLLTRIEAMIARHEE